MLPIPQGVYPDFSALSPQALAEKGIRLVLADLDNTLVSYHQALPTPAVIAWKEALNQVGITLFILSNSRKAGRVEEFAHALQTPCQSRSGKPKKKGYQRVLASLNTPPEHCLMVGDQIFTDILGATNMGIPAVLVHPVELHSDLGRRLRYQVLEAPFRHAGKKQPFIPYPAEK